MVKSSTLLDMKDPTSSFNQGTKDNRPAKVASHPEKAGMAYRSPWFPHVSVTKTHDELDELNELMSLMNLMKSWIYIYMYM